MPYKSQKGFTLVELSIVIVIIGLIVAGVVAGQSLVKQAQLRSVISESEQIKVAINAFKLEYNAIPGDFDSGSQYWAIGCNATGSGASVAADCDGDGNKQILMAAGNTGESYFAWYHLASARLYSGSFIPGAALNGLIGTNIPASKFSSTGITLIYDDAVTYATAGDGGAVGRESLKNVILFGGTVSSDFANATTFSVNQSKSVDDKVDDGSPTTGTVLGTGTTTEGAATCLASATTYNLDSTDAAPCAIAFTL